MMKNLSDFNLIRKPIGKCQSFSNDFARYKVLGSESGILTFQDLGLAGKLIFEIH